MKKIGFLVFAMLFIACSVFSQSTCPTLSVTASKTDATCFGSPDGKITLAFNSTLSSYDAVKVSVNNSANTQVVAPTSLTGTTWTSPSLGAGNYTVVVSGTCIISGLPAQVTRNVTVGQPTEFLVALPTNVSVCGTSARVVVLTPSVAGRPVSDIRYLWSTTATTSRISITATGEYSLTATDAAGCIAYASTTVTASAGPALTVTRSDANCPNPTGAAVVAASGVAPFTYKWSNGATTSGISGLANAGYSVSVTDAVGCSNAANAAINCAASCSCHRKICGYVAFDANANCTLDAGDQRIFCKKVKLTYNNGWCCKIACTDANGYYHFDLGLLDHGPFIVTPIDLNCLLTCHSQPTCTRSYTIPTVSSGQTACGNNFFYKPAPALFGDVSISTTCHNHITRGILHICPPKFTSTTHATVTNKGTTISKGWVKFYRNNCLVWAWPYIVCPGQSVCVSYVRHECFAWNAFTPGCGACVTDQTVTAVAHVDFGGDINLANNTSTCTTRGCSQDPNNKTVQPVRDESNGGIYTTDTDLSYIINFQNEGEVAAHYVRVEDVLDENKFDLSSIEVLGGSHPYTFERENNKIIFKFEDLELLPNRVDEEKSKGFVAFKIARKANLPVGTTIDNIASIYFDFNEPIITQPAHSTIISPLSNEVVAVAADQTLAIVPNPTQSSATAVVTVKEATAASVNIYDINGKLVSAIASQELNSGVNRIDLNVDQLSVGGYIIQVVTANGTLTSKLVKQ